MDRKPDYRRRRIGVLLGALAVLAIAQDRAPMIGTLSIGFDADTPLHVDAELTPMVDALATAVVYAAEQVRR